MRLYRICRVDHLESYRGLGAGYKDGGRWNEPGIPVLYFAETAGVAMLEMANYLPSPRLIPPAYRLGVYEVAGKMPMERWTVNDLPVGWDRFPYPAFTQRMGRRLAETGGCVPAGDSERRRARRLESIVLANPVRLAAGSIRLSAVHERLYNPRAFGGVSSR